MLYWCLFKYGIAKIQIVFQSFRVEFQIGEVNYIVDIVRCFVRLGVIK